MSCNNGEPILHLGSGETPEGAIDPFDTELPYGGVPLDAIDLTVTLSREHWQLLYDLATAKLEALAVAERAGSGIDPDYYSSLDTLQENLSQLVDPEHG